MPLNGDHRRIYPEPNHSRDPSPAHQEDYKTRSFPGSSVARLPLTTLTSGQAQQKTPSRGGLFGSDQKNYDGSADQRPRPATALKKSGPLRAELEPRRPAAATSRMHENRPDAASAATRRAMASGMKVEVPDTPMPSAPPMKHQTSQSTDSSVPERAGRHNDTSQGDRQFRFGPQGRLGTSNSYDGEETSATFDSGRFDDYGDYEHEPQPEATALLRGVPVSTRDDFVRGITPGELDNARQAQTNRPANQGVRARFDLPTQTNGIDGEHRYPVDDPTEIFVQEDRADFESVQRRHDEATPSKPPAPAAYPPKQRSVQNLTKKRASVKDTELHRPNERASSPLPFEDEIYKPNELGAMRAYGKEYLDQHQQEQAQTERAVVAQTSGHEALTASKVPESHETSEDEQLDRTAQAPTNKKRPYDQIDYDADNLTTMTYADLDSVPFLSDPRAPATQPAIDSNGTAISLEQRLANLSRMNSNDQSSFFRSLSDSENEDVGEWFMQRFADDLKRLMEVRLARRKTALTYELEAKKRQKEVDAKSADLENELSDLKKGGSQLIEGRASPRPARTT